MNGDDAAMPERSGRVARHMSLRFSVTRLGLEVHHTSPRSEVGHDNQVLFRSC